MSIINTYIYKGICSNIAYTSIQRKTHGFSLIESMITLSILSILVMTSTPSFSKLINNNKVKTTSYNLKSSLSLARQYAISNSVPVNLCALASLENTQCSGDTGFNSNWSHGWIVYADQNDNNQYDESDLLLNVIKNTHKVGVVFNQQGRLRFFQNGSARSAGFYLCNQSTAETRHVKLLYSGRARTTKIMTQRQQLICNSVSAQHN